jgi:hypothetical protein
MPGKIQKGRHSKNEHELPEDNGLDEQQRSEGHERDRMNKDSLQIRLLSNRPLAE